MQTNKRLCRVAYDGANYSGFSRSYEKKTIQQTIEDVLERIFDNSSLPSQIEFVSRTDKGVHALDQLITFSAPPYFESGKMLYILNQRLPLDIRVLSVYDVANDFNLHDQVKSKIYKYSLSKDINNPFISQYYWILRKLPDLQSLDQFLQLMVGEHDFALLAKESYRYASTVCRIYNIACTQNLEKEIKIEIEGNRFLYNMIRRMIGFAVFLSINQKTCPETYEEMISIYLHQTNMLAPASGLTLQKVNLLFDL